MTTFTAEEIIESIALEAELRKEKPSRHLGKVLNLAACNIRVDDIVDGAKVRWTWLTENEIRLIFADNTKVTVPVDEIITFFRPALTFAKDEIRIRQSLDDLINTTVEPTAHTVNVAV